MEYTLYNSLVGIVGLRVGVDTGEEQFPLVASIMRH